MTTAYPPFVDPVVAPEVQVRWTYWPVAYQFGDPTVISNRPLPLSGVAMTEVIRGVGEFAASLQLADDSVRALYPWDKVIPRKTGIVAVRESRGGPDAAWTAVAIQHYLVWAAPRDPQTGRMSITARTVESLWAMRLITKAITWTDVDQAVIPAGLLTPATFSLLPLGAGVWTGWINVDPPSNMTGVIRTFSYDGQETNLLEAHQNRSTVANGYEWRTSVRVLSGVDAASANTFRLQYVLGYPQLGRQIGQDLPVPRLRYSRLGGGNVLSFKLHYDGTGIANTVWGRGNGYEDLQVKATASYDEWQYGFLQTESRFSDPDVKRADTLLEYCYRQIWKSLSGEQFLASLTIRGDRPPYLTDWDLGDQLILDTDDVTWPADMYGSDGFVSILCRVYGRRIIPPQGGESEKVELLLAGGTPT